MKMETTFKLRLISSAIRQCNVVETYQIFGGICRLHQKPTLSHLIITAFWAHTFVGINCIIISIEVEKI